jgi:hypothetical protein
LLTLDVAASGVSVTRGDCFVRVWLGHGSVPTVARDGLIGASYVTLQGCGGNLVYFSEPAIDPEVSPMILPIGSPPAGSDFNFSPANACFYELTTVAFRLVTSAVVAARQVTLHLSDGAVDAFLVQAASTQGATLTRDYVFANWGTSPAQPGAAILTLIPTLRFGRGMTLNSLTGLIDAGDQLSNIRLNGLRCVDV